jgi:hypothetical protein
LAITIQYGDVIDYHFDDEFGEYIDEEEEELSNYNENLIDIAYEHNVLPYENCNWHNLVLERFKEKALADEKFELVALIQKELDKVEN